MSDVPFRRVQRTDGYLAIEDHGLIGDGTTAALVGRDGSIPWLCVPRFDDLPLFCGILDSARGGAFRLAPTEIRESRQYYVADTAVLVTEIRSQTGIVRVTDCLAVHGSADLVKPVAAATGQLLREVRGLQGSTTMTADVAPRGGAVPCPRAGGLHVVLPDRPDLDVQLDSTVQLQGLRTRFDVNAGDVAYFRLTWGDLPQEGPDPADCRQLLRSTVEAWRRWTAHLSYDGPQADLVHRSALTLKMLDYFASGALVAAPTSSLPEAIGGVRNWDYRFAWVRDAAFSVYALRRVGMTAEASGFLTWVLDAISRDGVTSVLYTLDGTQPPAERIDPELEGYRGSSPVRWGNAAADQRQHDVLGEVLDCAYQWSAHGGSLNRARSRLVELGTRARTRWNEPDHGIWEVRTPGRVFTYSAAMCHVAVDRCARLAEPLALGGESAAWRRDAEVILKAIVSDAWDEDQQSFTEHLGAGGGLDASLLALPLRRVVDARHPRMVSTVDAIQRRLGAGDGLLYRYLPDESPDGVGGEEGAFLLCSFWLVDNLALQGRLDEAHELYDSLCDRAGHLGLLPEQVDPATGAFLGNYPQALSHVGVISSGTNLARAERAKARTVRGN